MDSSPAPVSADHSSNISLDNSQNLGSSPLQGLDQHAYFPPMGPPANNVGQMNAAMQSAQGKNLQVEQQIAMLNAINGMNGQLAVEGHSLPSQPVSPNASNQANGMMTFSTPAGLSNPTHPVHTRPRGMTVGTVPILPMQFANYQPVTNSSASLTNGSTHATPESIYQMSNHLPRTQGPSPVPASPFNTHPRDAMSARTAPSSPGNQTFAQEMENKAFMNAVLTTPQRVMSANFTLQEAPRSLHEYNPVPTLENQAMAYGRGMSEMKMTPIPMSVSNSQTSFAPTSHLPGSAGSVEDGSGSKSRMGSRRPSTTALAQTNSAGLQMNAPSGAQEIQSASGQSLTITTDSSQVEELSHDLRDKLSFLTKCVLVKLATKKPKS